MSGVRGVTASPRAGGARPSPARWPLRLFVAGQGVNGLGSAISSVALPLVAVERLHASTFTVGALEAVEWIPAVVVGLPVGALVDRHPERTRTVMILANLAQAAAAATVPAAAAAGRLSLAVLAGAACALGFFTVFFQAGYAPYLRSLAVGDDLLQATSRARGAQSAASLSGPALAGALVQAVGSATTVLADAASFLVSLASLAATRPPRSPPPPAGPPARLRDQIAEGVRHLWASPLLRTLAWATAGANLLLTAMGALEVVFLVRAVHLQAAWIGGLFALGGAGSLAGSLLAGRLARRLGLARLARCAVAVTAPGALLMPLTRHGAGVAFFAVAGPTASLGIALASVGFLTLRLQHCPAHLQARVSTASRTLTAATIPLGALLGGALGQLLGTRLALLVVAGGYVAFGLCLLASSALAAPAAGGDRSGWAADPVEDVAT